MTFRKLSDSEAQLHQPPTPANGFSLPGLHGSKAIRCQKTNQRTNTADPPETAASVSSMELHHIPA
jgi:hypothetical protein